MKYKDNMVIVDYPNGQITFHKDLKKYFEIKQHFEEWEFKLQQIVASGKESDTISDAIRDCLHQMVSTDILPSLSKHGIYTLTVEDFLVGNSGLVEILNATVENLQNELDTREAVQAATRNAKDLAAQNAASNVTGLGFGILSNDLLAHAVYAAKAQSVLSQQAENAKWQYQKAAMEINTQANLLLYDKLSEAKKVFNTKVQANIPVAINHCMKIYLTQLSKTGKISIDCLDGIDEARSTNIVTQNIDHVLSKDNLIYNAIQLCPYNILVYMKAYDVTRLNSTHKEILEYFNLIDGLTSFIIFERGSNANYRLDDTLKEVHKAAETCAFLGNSREEDYFAIMLGNRLDYDLRLYRKYGELIKKKDKDEIISESQNDFGELYRASLHSFSFSFSTFSKSEIIKDSHLSSSELSIYSSAGFNVFSIISNYFGSMITSFEDVDKILYDICLPLLEWKDNNEAIKRLNRENEMSKNADKQKSENVTWYFLGCFMLGAVLGIFKVFELAIFLAIIGIIGVIGSAIFTYVNGTTLRTRKVNEENAARILELNKRNDKIIINFNKKCNEFGESS